MVLTLPRVIDGFVPRRSSEQINNDRGPLGRVLLRLRGETGLLQKEIAERGGFTQGYYSNVETGEIRDPGVARLLALDRGFGLEPGTIKDRLREERRRSRLAEQRPHYDLGAIEYVEQDARGRIVALLRNVPDEDAHLFLQIIERMVRHEDWEEPDA